MTPDLPRQKVVDFKNYFAMQSQQQQFEDYTFNVNFATTTTQPDLLFEERSVSKPVGMSEELTLEKIKKKNMTTSEVIQTLKTQLKESTSNDTPKQSPLSKASESDPLWAYSDQLKVELKQMNKDRYKQQPASSSYKKDIFERIANNERKKKSQAYNSDKGPLEFSSKQRLITEISQSDSSPGVESLHSLEEKKKLFFEKKRSIPTYFAQPYVPNSQTNLPKIDNNGKKFFHYRNNSNGTLN